MATIQAPTNGLHEAKQQIAAELDLLDTAIAEMTTYLAIASPTNAQHFAQVKTLAQDVRQMARIQKRTLRALRDLMKQIGT